MFNRIVKLSETREDKVNEIKSKIESEKSKYRIKA